ncbi:hypothetical protein [Streptomyces sp. NPDC053427]|uniref:hypothetical protein n=1 Tax=Streptomyces sp. NPDC053427 TaxID=3365701 RepID=UPI0037D39A6D
MPELKRLHVGQAPAVLAFELATAELGYRVAQHGLRTLRAAAARRNVASQKVLTKAGSVPVGTADPAHIGGKPGTWYQRDLGEALRARAAVGPAP